jgi:hypothetical protein
MSLVRAVDAARSSTVRPHPTWNVSKLPGPERRTTSVSAGQCRVVGLRGLESVTSSLSDPTTNYADVILGCQDEWRIMGNAQVEATVDTRADPWFLTVLPYLLGSLRQVVAARLLPRRLSSRAARVGELIPRQANRVVHGAAA